MLATSICKCMLAKRYHVTPVITFDQPLWLKALMIIRSEPQDSELKSIVLRLGGLDTKVSFLGCIGYIMAGSGLQEVLKLVYAKNAVGHMLTGKAVARAIRGHFLVDAACWCAIHLTFPCQSTPVLTMQSKRVMSLQVQRNNKRMQPGLTSLQVQRSTRKTQLSLTSLQVQRSNRKTQPSPMSLLTQI